MAGLIISLFLSNITKPCIWPPNEIPLTFDLSKAPNGTKVLNSNYNAVSKIEIYDDFYISVPNSAKEQKFDIKILRENGTVNPLCYEEKNENRQRMFFSNISSAVTSLSIVHTQSDAKIKIVKTSEDGRKDNFDFNVSSFILLIRLILRLMKMDTTLK